MFETGMSALVLKICSEYAKSLGLNFPPCTQQEINAICDWVDKHTIKDMTISQDGFNVTFTFKTENDVTKEFTFTIPKTIDVEELAKVLVGSESVVVERLENNSGLRVRLDQSVLDNINSKLTKPANPTSDSVVTMLADGTVGTKPLSEIGGGKLYLHKVKVNFRYNSSQNGKLVLNNIYNTSDTQLTTEALLSPYMDRIIGIGCISDFQIGGMGAGSPSSTGGIIFINDTSAMIYLYGDLQGNSTVSMINGEYTINSISDTVTEL